MYKINFSISEKNLIIINCNTFDYTGSFKKLNFSKQRANDKEIFCKLNYFKYCFLYSSKTCNKKFYRFVFVKLHLLIISNLLKIIFLRCLKFFKKYLHEIFYCFIPEIIQILFGRRIFSKICVFNVKYFLLQLKMLFLKFRKKFKFIKRYRFRLRKKYYNFSKYKVTLIRKYLRFSRKKRNIGRRFICYSRQAKFFRKRNRRLMLLREFNFEAMENSMYLLLQIKKFIKKKNVDG